MPKLIFNKPRMKKIISFLILFSCVQIAFTQRSSFYISENRLFFEGKTMFEDKNYPGCIDKLKEYKKTVSDLDLLEETEYMLLVCNYKQGKSVTPSALKEYLDNYPANVHVDEMAFMIGSLHFEYKEYLLAVHWFKRANLDNLSLENQEDYAYRMALSYLKTGKNKDEAQRLFGLLSQNSGKYHYAAIYYLACVDYDDKNYNSALNGFNKLTEKQEFQPEVFYCITQINFAQGHYSQTIKEGNELLDRYPDNERNTDLCRIVGISYFREDNYKSASQYLLKYAESTNNPNRNDLYTLGFSLYNIKNYNKAIEYFGKVITKNDALGQNANFFLGQSYLKIGNQKNALMAFEAAAHSNFDAQTKEAATYNYAILLHQTSISPFGESVTVLENFLNTYPNSIYADKINNCLVEVYLTTKNYETALKSIQKIKNPGNKILEAKQKIFYHLGTINFTNSQYDVAIDYFTKAINTGNYAPEEKLAAIYWRGESYYRKGEYDLAITDFQSFKNLEAPKDNNLFVLSNYNLGYSFFSKEQYSQALNYFSSYIGMENNKTKTTLADAYARLGDCYFQARNFIASENAYAQSAVLQPSMADYTTYQKGFVLGLQKDYKGKIGQMDNLIKNFPDSRYVPEALYEKGRAYVMLENSKSAIESFNVLWEKYPESSLARKAGLQIGLLYFNNNEPQKSATAYKKVIGKYPGSEEAKVAVQDLKSVYVDLNDVTGYAQYINSLGNVEKFETSEQDSLTYLAAERFFTKGDITQAQSALKKYLQTFPNGAFNTKAHYYLGNTYHNKGDYALAKSEYKQVLETGDNSFTEETLIRLAEIQYKEKDYNGALPTYERLSNVAESKSGKENGLIGVMRCALQLNKYADALNASNKLLKETNLSPELSTEAKYTQGKAYLGLKEQAKAILPLKEISKDTRSTYGAEAKYLCAQYYFDQKQYDKAEAEVLDYIKTGTSHSYWLARSYILLSDVYIAKKDYLQARQYLESLKQNYKEKNDIQEIINERLEKIN